MNTPCECPNAGYCQRHKCEKTGHWHYLCQTSIDYFNLWEQGNGPCLDKPINPQQKPCNCRKQGKPN